MTSLASLRSLRTVILASVIALLAAGCGQGGGSSGGGHAHTAPHGGKLVEVGEHAYNLEFVVDREVGKLTAYVLDGHAENFIRTDLAGIALTVNGRPLTLAPVANSATGETVGSTAQFEASADWLKAPGAQLTVNIPALTLRGSAFTAIEATLP
ncbi:MAG TPA: hypothetical protein VGD88_13225 [Opitutaceae bacterium]